MSNGVPGSFVWGTSSSCLWKSHPSPFRFWKAPSSYIFIRKSWLEEVTAKLKVWKDENLVQSAITNGQPLLISTFPSGLGLGHFVEHQFLHQEEGISTSSSYWQWHGMFFLSCWMRNQLGKGGRISGNRYPVPMLPPLGTWSPQF